MPTDQLQSFLLQSLPLRGQLIQLQASFSEIISQHHYPLALQYLLGQLLAVSVFYSTNQQTESETTLQFQSEGDLKLLVAKCNHLRQIRATGNWEGVLNPSSIQQAISHGQLVLTTLLLANQQRFQGIIDVGRLTFIGAIERYFLQSEQIPTTMRIAVHDDRVVAFILQVMPEQDSHAALDWNHWLTQVKSISEQQLLDSDVSELFITLFPEHDFRLYDAEHVSFNCPCSEQRMLRAVKTLGQDEADDILNANQVIDVTCEFCNMTYAFGRDQVQNLFTQR